MRPTLTKWIAAALTLGTCFAQGAPRTANLDTTAISLYFLSNPRAELASKETLSAIAAIKEEVRALLDSKIVAAKHDEFFLPEPFVYGKLTFRLTDAVMATLQGNIGPDGVLDVSGPIGVAALDALNRKWNITKYNLPRPKSTYFEATFDPGINPNVVADSFTVAAAEVKWATASGLSFIGGGTEVRRIAPENRGRNYPPPVYVLTLGWGDCPAGCIAVHRDYYEVRYRPAPDGILLAPIGEAGTLLPADMRAEYYK